MEQQKNESVAILFSPYKYDYRPWDFNITYDGRMRPASLNNTVNFFSRMGSSQYVNKTLTTILSNIGADISADVPFGIDGKAVLCPPKGCYTPPTINIITKSYWSDPTSWPSGKLPVAFDDVRYYYPYFFTYDYLHWM